jgi:hypothetical protein
LKKEALVKGIIYLVVVQLLGFGWCANSYAAGVSGNINFGVIPEAEIDWTVFRVSENRGYGTVFLRGSKGSGDFSQTLRAGETIEIEKTGDTFTGSTNVSTDVDFSNVNLGFRYTMNVSETFSAVFGAHAGIFRQQLTTTDGTQKVRYEQNMFSPIFLSLGGIYRPNDWLQIEAVVSPHNYVYEMVYDIFLRDDYVDRFDEMHIKLTVSQNKNIQYFLGYRTMNYSYTKDRDSDPAAIRLDYSGMYGGLSFRF